MQKPLAKKNKKKKLPPPGYARPPYQDADHAMQVAASINTGFGMESNPAILDALPVNLCVIRDLVSWDSRFLAEKWLAKNEVKLSSRAYRLHFYEACKEDLSNLRSSEPFGGVLIVDRNHKILATIPTIISWNDSVVLVSFKHDNKWNTGRLGKPFCESSKGAIWHLKSAFIDNKENVHPHEDMADVSKYPAKEFHDLFLHSYQKRAADSYKRMCDSVASHVFERVVCTKEEDPPTPEMIYRTPPCVTPGVRGFIEPRPRPFGIAKSPLRRPRAFGFAKLAPRAFGSPLNL